MKLTEKNKTTKDILLNTIRAALGLAFFGVGIYFTIQANIGVAPWDCFYLGIEKATGIKYGNISVCASLIIITINVILKERIGIGTLTDAIVVGKTVDLCNALNLVPEQTSMWTGIAFMLIGLLINGVGQYIYMQSALCCQSKRWSSPGVKQENAESSYRCRWRHDKWSSFAFRLDPGRPIGIGTILGVLLMTPIMQMVFQVMHFEPKAVIHQDLIQSSRVISSSLRKK